MSLAADIYKYKKYTSEHLNKMKEYYEKLSSINKVIYNASTGKNDSSKMDPHQWRVGKENGINGYNELIKKKSNIENAQSFEDVFEITESVREEIYGLGDLWSYDTALRIGFYLRKYPKDVYIQRGVITGVIKLFGNNPRERKIQKFLFPQELQELESYEIENFLCIWGKNENKKNIC